MATAGVRDIYPLTPMQQGMLYHSVADGVPGLYCEQVVFELPASTDLALWQQAFESLVAEHAVLRTAFEWEDLSRPVQVVRAPAPLPFERRDWSRVDTDTLEAQLEAFMNEDRVRGFDFRKPPLLRLSALILGDGSTRVVMTFHHIVLDGWSVSVLMGELEARYAHVTLPSARPFKDFIGWLLTRNPAASEAAWRAELLGIGGVPTFPESQLGTVARAEFDEASEYLDVATTTAVSEMAAAHGLTLNTLVQGAWALTLASQTGSDQVVFGATVSGRPAELGRVESMMGMFINTLPVFARVSESICVAGWLRELQARHASLREHHEHTPLASIQQWCGRQPLFETLVVFQNFPPDSMLRGRNRHGWSAWIRPRQLTNYPLHLFVVPLDRLHLHATFDRSRMDEAMVRRLLRRTAHLLCAMAQNPDVSITQLPTVTPEERSTLLGWSSVGSAPPHEDVRARVRAQAKQRSNTTAVSHRGDSISYAELEGRVCDIAMALQQRRIERGAIVPICARRSVDFIAAVLGVMRAGLVYLPLDPDDPQLRIKSALSRAGAKVMLVDDTPASMPDGVTALRLRDVGKAEGPIPFVPVSSADIAYVLFTSGSTGTPKGAMVSYGGLWNHLQAKVECLGLRETDIVAQTATQSFDISIWQMLAVLLAGGQVRIYDDEVARDAGALLAAMEQDRVTILQGVPSLLQLLPDEARHCTPFPCLSSMRFVVPTGEALPAEFCRRWFATWPGIPLVNAYGPTECSDDVTHYEMREAPSPDVLRIPIGSPIPGARIYLLDQHLRLAPPGASGELCVAGVCVGQGYLAAAELTAAAFLPEPFDGDGERLYRTGDAARFLPDGTLEYLGRRDSQVKLHGYRIELGEIELRVSQLAKCPAVVLLHRAGEALQLVAYLERYEALCPLEDLRAALSDWLPAYMIPTSFVVLERFPRLPSGKLDRPSLPAPAPTRIQGAAPQSEAERRLLGIWRELLKTPQVGTDDNFFEVGGDSIRSIQLVAKARRAGVLIEQRDVFRHQTVAELARVARLEERNPVPPPAPQGRVPLTPMQRWFFAGTQAHSSKWCLTLVVDASRDLDAARLHAAACAVAARHDALRLCFSRDEQGWSQSVGEPQVAFLVRQPTGLTDSAAIAAGAAVLAEALDIGAGPKMALALLKREGRYDRFLLAVHHLCTDAISMQWLLEDIEDVYVGFEREQQAAMPERGTSFTDWARGMDSLAGSSALAQDRAFWSRPFARMHETGIERGEVRSRTHQLSVQESRRMLEELPLEQAATPEGLLLTALIRALTDTTHQRQWIIDVEHHGRDGAAPGTNIARAVGFFTMMFPVELVVSQGDTLAQTLRAVKTALRARQHAAGWGLLRHVEHDAACCAWPHADVRINYIGKLDGTAHPDRLFRLATEHMLDIPVTPAPDEWLLDAAAFALDGVLHLWLTTSLTAPAAEQFAEALRRQLSALVSSQAFARETAYIAADFPHAHLDESTLRCVLTQLGNLRQESP